MKTKRFRFEEETSVIFSILAASHPLNRQATCLITQKGQSEHKHQTLCNESYYGQYGLENNDSDWCVYSVTSPQRLRRGNAAMPVRYFSAGDDISLPAFLPVISFLIRIQQYFSAIFFQFHAFFFLFFSST